jgi:hypothetical protein
VVNKKIIIAIIFFLMVFSIDAMNITIANFSLYPENLDITITKEESNCTVYFYNELLRKEYNARASVMQVPKIYENKEIKSSNEAAEMCELLQIQNLVYGTIKKTNKYYDAEIKIYDNEKKEIRKIFYEKMEIGEYKELITNLSNKVYNYLISLLGISDEIEEGKRKFGGINIYNAVGYYFPIGDWWYVDTGIVSFETGVSVEPLVPITKRGFFGFYLRYGLYIGYSLGINKPDFLTSYLNSLFFKIPIEVCFELYKSNVITIGFGPQLQLDILYQKRLYDDPKTTITSAFSLVCSTGYEHWFGSQRNIAIGVNNVFDLSFYKINFYADYKIYLYVGYKIKFPEKKKITNDKFDNSGDNIIISK